MSDSDASQTNSLLYKAEENRSANSKLKRMTIATTILGLALGQIYLSVSFAQPGSVPPRETVPMMPQQNTGILATRGNKQIKINGINSISGATIVSGASIETPLDVSATVSLIGSGSLEIETNTKLIAEFDQSVIKVILTDGCVTLHTTKGTVGEVITPQRSTMKTDPAQDGKVATCPQLNTTQTGPGSEARGLFSLGRAAALAVIARGETTVAIPVAPRGVLY